jgi:hypothetical protein
LRHEQPSGNQFIREPWGHLWRFPQSADCYGRPGRPFESLPWTGSLELGYLHRKTTTITERVHATFAADFFNIFNHVIYCDPGAGNGNGGACGGSLNLNALPTFGVISSQWVPANRVAGSRWIQLSVRFEF